MDWHCHAMSVLGVHKIIFILSNYPVMVDEVAAFTVLCCVCGYHVYHLVWTQYATMYTITCGLNMLPCIPSRVDSICYHVYHHVWTQYATMYTITCGLNMLPCIPSRVDSICYHVYHHVWTQYAGEIATAVRNQITQVMATCRIATLPLHTVLPLHYVEYHV